MKQLISALSIAAILVSCNQQTSLTNNAPVPQSVSTATGNNLISFKVNGQEVKTSGWTISRFAYNNDPLKIWLNITTNMHEEKRTINMNISGSVPGVYDFEERVAGNKGSHGSFYPDYMEDLIHSYSFVKGTFAISSIDTLKRTLNAEFSGTVQNLQGEAIEITAGKIVNGTLNPGMIRY